MEPTEPKPPPQPADHPNNPFQLDREMLRFLREESNEAREALRRESDSNRKLLEGALKIVAIPLAVVIAIAGFLGWHSIGDMERSIQSEAKAETSAEVLSMQNEIRGRLTAQFQTPKIQKMVREAALSQTQNVLRPLIVHEVKHDVASSVNREQKNIKSALIKETHKDVDNLKPTINDIVATRVNATVDKAVESKIDSEIQPILTHMQRDQHIENLMLRALGEDGQAFDQLASLALNPSTNTNTRRSALEVAREIIHLHNSAEYESRGFIQKRTDTQMLALLNSPDAGTRQAVLDSLSLAAVKKNLPEIMHVMTTDTNLMVREAGFRRFNQAIGKQKPQDQILNLDNYHANLWWQEHGAEFEEQNK